MVGWHHQLNGHELEQTLGDSEGQGSLACCSPWGCKGSDMTEQLNDNKKKECGTDGEESWVFIGSTDVEVETPILWPHDVKS